MRTFGTDRVMTWSGEVWRAAATPARAAPVALASPRPTLSAVSVQALRPPRHAGAGIGRVVVGLLWKMAIIGIASFPFWARSAAEQEQKSAELRASMTRTFVAPPTPRQVTPAPKPVPKAAPAPRVVTLEPAPEPAAEPTMTYRGVGIYASEVDGGKRYAALGLDTASSDLQSLRVEINRRVFRQATGIESAPTESAYAAADTDGNGELSWGEIEGFQTALQARYEYRANDIALRPDEFLRQGGGDCDDWALMSAGLMRFWGLTAYVGIYSASGVTSAHAVCLVRAGQVPPGYAWYEIQSQATWGGGAVEPKRYVVVDYDCVGRTSKAVGSGSTLTQFYEPERMYGRPL